MENKVYTKKEAFQYGWETFKKNSTVLLLISIVYLFINMVMQIDTKDAHGTSLIVFSLLKVVASIFNIFLGFNLIRIFLNIYDGKKVEFKDLFRKIEWKNFWSYVWTSIKYSVIVLVGFILLIVPGMIWSLKYYFAPYLVIDKKMKSNEVFKLSDKLTNGYKWDLFLFSLLSCLIGLLGLVCLFVGVLVAIPVITMANIYIYRKLLNKVNA